MGKKKKIRQLEERVSATWDIYIGLKVAICRMHIPGMDGLCVECSHEFPCKTQLRASNGGKAVAGEDIPVTLPTADMSYSSLMLERERYRSDLLFELAEHTDFENREPSMGIFREVETDGR